MSLRLGAVAVAGLVAISGCGGGEQKTETTSAIPPASVASASAFDVFVAASEAGQIQLADVYAISFNPPRVYRITTDKRISAISASTEQIVVAAADEQIDKLGEVGPDGSIVAIAGLGRPAAFNPQLLPDGTIRFEDNQGDGRKEDRYLEWSPRNGEHTILHSTQADRLAFSAGPSGRFLKVFDDSSGQERLALFGPGDKQRSYAMPADSGTAQWGAKLIAISLREETGAMFPVPVGTLLLDPASGKRATVDGWSPLSWSPDGTKLLVVRAGGEAGTPTELGVLSEDDPTSVRSIGTIPYLQIYGGSWVRGEPIGG